MTRSVPVKPVEVIAAALSLRLRPELARDCAEDAVYALRHAGFSITRMRPRKTAQRSTTQRGRIVLGLVLPVVLAVAALVGVVVPQ